MQRLNILHAGPTEMKPFCREEIKFVTRKCFRLNGSKQKITSGRRTLTQRLQIGAQNLDKNPSIRMPTQRRQTSLSAY